MNGGIIGKNNRPTSNIARGIWNLNELYHARLDSEWPGSALQVDVGSFTKIGTVTTQTVNLTGGKTWTPKCIIFFTGGSNAASGTWNPTIAQTIGFTAGPSNSYSASGWSTDNLATSETARRMAAAAITSPDNTGATTYYEASLSSFGAGSFTLNWTTNTSYATVIGYIAFGGDIQAEVLNWQTPTSTGNKVVSTGTFQPDLVLHMTTLQTALGSTTYHILGLGAMNSAGEQWTVSVAADDAAPTVSDTARYQRTDKAIAAMNGSAGGVVSEQASYVSMDATGFTVNFDTIIGGAGNQRQYASLCIKGVNSKLGAFNVGSSPQSVTGVGFQPGAIIGANYSGLATSSVRVHARLSIGAYDGTNQRVVQAQDTDNVNPTQADSLWTSGQTFQVASGPSVVDGGSVTAVSADGFTVTWSPSSAAGYQILYAAIGTS